MIFSQINLRAADIHFSIKGKRDSVIRAAVTARPRLVLKGNAIETNAAWGKPTATVGAAQARLLLVVVILIWGANWPVMRVGVSLVPPLWFVVARLVLGLLSLALPLVLTGRLRLPPRHDLPVVFSLGLLQMALFLILITVGVQFVPAGRSALLAYTHPLLVAPGAVLLLGERLRRAQLMGLALGLAGLVILFNPATFPWTNRNAVLGNALLLSAALLWGIGLLHARRHRWLASPLALAPWQMLVALPLVLVAALWWGDNRPVRWSPELVAILVYNGPIATAFCYWAAVTVTRALPALTTSVGFLGVPMTGIALSTALLGERFTWSLAGGLILILSGLALVNLADLRRLRITRDE